MKNTSSTSRALNHDRWRTVLQIISVVVAIEIALHSFIVREPMLTLVGAALWLGAGVFWTRRGGNGGPLAIGFLATFEVLATLSRTSLQIKPMSRPGSLRLTWSWWQPPWSL